jgi:hypothetical protein
MSFMVHAFSVVRDTILGVFKTIGKSGLLGGDLKKFIGEEEQKGQSKDLRKSLLSSGGLSDQDYEKRRAAFVKSGIEGGMNAEDSAKDFEKLYRGAMDTHLGVMRQAEGAKVAAMNDDAKGYATAFNAAAAAGDEAAMKYVASFLDGNASMVNAIAKEGPKIFEGGYDKLVASLKGIGAGDAAKSLMDRSKVSLGTPSKTSITQNFTGAINVKQDFRDQDPDRVAVTFKQDLQRAGTNRLQSRFAQPFSF